MLRFIMAMILMPSSMAVGASSTMSYSCEEGYSVTVSVDGAKGVMKVFKDSRPVALTKSDKFHIDLESHAYDMDGNTIFNYSAYKGFDHTVESVPLSDFYTLITKSMVISKPQKKSKLQVILSGQKSSLFDCNLSLDLSGIEFPK
ncbi:hypothetical protein ACO1ZL_10525 [Escherichia coli]|uniref:hypothetical protein n=1 Tax=Escherichia coli TaxID=562 RepID=UPI001D24B8F3|nr:hypothetical protein [Escherichia coli]